MRLITMVFILITTSACGKKNGTSDELKTMIRVIGADGIEFEGALGTLGSTSSVIGVTPQEFKLSPKDPISAVIQKSTKGDLREIIVECWHDSLKPAETAKTSVEYGVASVSCS